MGGEGVNFTTKWQNNSVDVESFIVRNVFLKNSSVVDENGTKTGNKQNMNNKGFLPVATLGDFSDTYKVNLIISSGFYDSFK